MSLPAGLLDAWKAAWPAALAAWSRFTKLSEPRWCSTVAARHEGLTGSFAMIRLTDHAVVIDLEGAQAQGVAGFATEILAHEIGHHVYAPGDLRDNARLLARVRRGLPGREDQAPMVANLYTDLLINDRLQRSAGLDLVGVYAALKPPSGVNPLWQLYLRIYEDLWRLTPGRLGGGQDPELTTDAHLGSRLIRVYASSWLEGAGRFACLLQPYLERVKPAMGQRQLVPWQDAVGQAGDEIPDGLTDLDDGEEDGAIHPSEDPRITGLDTDADSGKGTARATVGGRKSHREPSDFLDLMKSLGVNLSEAEMVVRYYRERAVPHLIPFPVRTLAAATEPQPEGLSPWDPGQPMQRIDWIGTLVRSPVVIPGVTTVERIQTTEPGADRQRIPLDCYIGIDCSGSMGNPAGHLSYPVVAGAVIALSALRAGARVMACLSGEPGEYSQTEGFIRDEKAILTTLTSYLGTGYSFGIGRLHDTFLTGEKLLRPAHLLVVTDADLFLMLDQHPGGWDIAQRALPAAGGGGTCVLHLSEGSYAEPISRLRAMGWVVCCVQDQADLVAFARAFSRRLYAAPGQP